jgi:hypothetical protein
MERLPGDWKSQQQRQSQPALTAIDCQGAAAKPYRGSQFHEATQRITEALKRDENTERIEAQEVNAGRIITI